MFWKSYWTWSLKFHCSNKGKSLEGEKRYDEAIKSYDLAISLDPSFGEAYYNKGYAF